jgi:glycosyltransferase involved in cell wall biosynthesis
VPELAGLRLFLLLATSTGGVGQHVRSLVAGLSGRGATVTVLGPAATEQLFGFTALGATFAPVEIASGPRPVADAGALRRLRVVLRDADVVHAHGLRAGLLSVLARSRGLPVAVTLHNAVLAGGIAATVYGVLERRVVRGADVVLAASADLAAHARALGGRDVRPLPVAAPPLPPPRRAALEVRAELGAATRPLVLAVGRLHRQKGFDVLVDAAARLAARAGPPVVAIAGSGPEEDALRRRVEATGAPVTLLGRRTDVADLLAAADVVVLPSRWEARALVAQEALREGKPLVATAVGGLPELVGDAARLVPAGDPAALAAAVTALLDDPVAAASLGQRGQARAATWPDEDRMLAHLAALYADLAGR